MDPSLLFLTGEYEHRIDAKNRLFIPSGLRDAINTDRQGLGFFLVLGANTILALYPDEYYQRLTAGNQAKLVRSAEAVDFDRVNFALANYLDLDGNNRLTLPGRMLERAGIGKDVVLIGARDHIEIWDAKVWKQYLQEHLDDYEQVLDLGRTAQRQETKGYNNSTRRSY